MDRNYLELLRCLNDFKVKYLIIGGYAVIRLTEPRYTKDLDIWIEPSLPNARKVLRALSKFGAPVDNLTEKELATPGLIYVFGVPPLRVDILNKATGVTFTTAWKNREVVPLGKVKASFIDRTNLIKNKVATGRPQDLADVEKLRF